METDEDMQIEQESESIAPNILEQLYGSIVEEAENKETVPDSSDIVEMPVYQDVITEKSVDSVENIDKMGIENELTDIDAFIEEAFRLKKQGDLEGAALYYLYVLDSRPSRNLVFWIVLDICVIYKELGQESLAMDILSGYAEKYSEVMSYDIRKEIERNLFS
jgi:hypothetical protein